VAARLPAPIGVWTSLSENDKGLKVKGELILDGVPQAAVAHALLKRRAIKGLSIGYQTKQAEVDRTTGARMLKEVDLWEISLVTFPMMPEAQLTAVKAIREF
jgi:HK97 family phage prohead protease